MKPGPVKGFRPHRELKLRVKPYGTECQEHGGQCVIRDVTVRVNGRAYNQGTPFEYWAFPVTESILNDSLQLGDVHWESDWAGTRWFAASKSGDPVASVQVLDADYSQDDVKEFRARSDLK